MQAKMSMREYSKYKTQIKMAPTCCCVFKQLLLQIFTSQVKQKSLKIRLETENLPLSVA